MRCRRHPSAECLPHKCICFLCQDWHDSYAIESDHNKFQYDLMAQHVEPGVTGIRTKGQYQRFLKRRGLTDDIPVKELQHLAANRSKRERVREEKITSFLTRLTPSLAVKAASW